MNFAAARSLVALNNAFYQEHAASFSATRSAPWMGWSQMADVVQAELDGEGTAMPDPLHILDLACGNLRLERFLAQRLKTTHPVFVAQDSCPKLAHDIPDNCTFQQLDILERFLGGPESQCPPGGSRPEEAANDSLATASDDLNDLDAAAPYMRGKDVAAKMDVQDAFDLACCFGFMHHVPGRALRVAVLAYLMEALRPGGVAAVSFWQFMNDPRLARKAKATTEQARSEHAHQDIANTLEEGDWLLGWQDDGSALRYCHHFCEREIDELVSALPAGMATEISRFSADGKTGTLNRYIMLKRQ